LFSLCGSLFSVTFPWEREYFPSASREIRSVERRRRPGNPSPQKTNNSTDDLVRNEENEYSVPDPNRTMINITNEFSDTHKKISERGNCG
jgi:hypothetical protein